MGRLIWYVLWPSMMAAAVAEIAFFSVLDPQELYLFGQPVHYSPVATYSIGFLGFWVACAGSRLLTSLLTRSGAEVNKEIGAGGTAH